MIKRNIGAALLGVFAFSGIVAHAGEINKSGEKIEDASVEIGQSKPLAESQLQQSTASQPAGRTAYIDPATGKLQSGPASPAQVIQPSSVVSEANLPPVKVTTHTNGMVQVDLNGRFRIPLQATVGCDGEITTKHSDQRLTPESNCEAEK